MWEGGRKGGGGGWGFPTSALHDLGLPWFKLLHFCSEIVCSPDLLMQATSSASAVSRSLWGGLEPPDLFLKPEPLTAHQPAAQPRLCKVCLEPQSSCFINTTHNKKDQPEWQLQRHSSPKMWYLITEGFCGRIAYNPKFKSFLTFRGFQYQNPFRIFQSV